MARPTIERAYELARSGQAASLPALKRLLQAEGCRAIDALLAPRSISSHLEAIIAASCRQPVDPETHREPA